MRIHPRRGTYPQNAPISPYVGMIQIRSQVRAMQPTLSPLRRAPFLLLKYTAGGQVLQVPGAGHIFLRVAMS